MAFAEADAPLWIFGYGSLVWRPAFPFAERREGFVLGLARRFWQGSTDHRGLPERPGRVVTLVAEADAVCWGSVYRLAAEERESVLARLDHRERGGFARQQVSVQLRGAEGAAVRAFTYVARPENPNYLGPAPIHEIAEQVQRSHGPSGSNREYVLELARSLERMGAEDDHVFELARLLGAQAKGRSPMIVTRSITRRSGK